MRIFILAIFLSILSVNNIKAKTTQNDVNVVIRIDGIIETELVTKLEDIGLRNYDILNAVNMIKGRISYDQLDKLKALEKIRYVQEDEIITSQ